jgi:hypothetical protein
MQSIDESRRAALLPFTVFDSLITMIETVVHPDNLLPRRQSDCTLELKEVR